MAETATTTGTGQVTESTAAVNQNTAAETTPAQSNENSQTEAKNNDFEAMIQRAVDRATNKLGNENKKLRGEIETLKKANMDADELKKFELSEKEKAIAEREQALNDKANRLHAIKAIEDAGLGDGKGASLAIVEFVMADTEEAINEKVKAFDALVKRLVETKVADVFKANGRTPGTGNTAAATTTDSKNNVAVQLGQSAAKVNAAARSTLDHYLGGNKK